MTRMIVMLAAVLAMTACQMSDGTGTGGGQSSAQQVGGRSPLLVAQECEAAGGTMVVGLAGPQCGRAQPDAGKACSDSDQCAGFCVAETRTCSPVTPYFGCHGVLVGGESSTICID